MTKSQQKALGNWEKEIHKALQTGKGKYQEMWACDLHDWLKVIILLKSGDLKKAQKQWDEFEETYGVSQTICDIFE